VKYVLLEFLLNLLNIHWWIWIALCMFVAVKNAGDEEDEQVSKHAIGFIIGGGGIYLFERYVGSAQSFRVADFLTIAAMTWLLGMIIKGQKSKTQPPQNTVAENPASIPISKGSYTYPDGTTYKGEWKDGKCHGKGTQTSPNGRTLSGQWKDGHFLGKSTVKKTVKKSAPSSARTQKGSKPMRKIDRYSDEEPYILCRQCLRKKLRQLFDDPSSEVCIQCQQQSDVKQPNTSASQQSSSIRKQLRELKSLLEDDLINEADYDKKKSELLDKM